jgi:hypothetical protein
MAQTQSQFNIKNAIANDILNNVNQVTPYGTVTYAYGTPPAQAPSRAQLAKQPFTVV